MFEKIRRFLFKNTSTRQTIAKNTVWLFGGEIASRLLKMFLIIYAARLLGVAGWGTFSYVVALATFFMTFSDVGLSSLVTREMAKDNEEKMSYLSTAFYMKITLLALTFVALACIAPFFISAADARSLIIPISLFLLLDSLTQFGIAIVRAFEKMEHEALVKVLNGFAVSIIGIIALLYTATPYSLATAYVVGASIGLCGTMFLLRKFMRPLLCHFDRTLIRPILIAVWPLVILGLFGTLLTIDAIMLGWWRSAHDVGLYSVAQRLTQFANILPTFIGIAIFPAFSRLAKKDDTKLRTIIRQSSALLLMIALPIVVGGLIFGKEIIVYLFGSAYATAAPAFMIFCLTIPLFFVNTVMIQAIFAYDKQKDVVPIMLWATLLNIALNSVLIPPYGINGAAIATLASYILMSILFWKKMQRINQFTLFPLLRKIIWTSVLMMIASFALKSTALHILIIIPLLAIFYFALLLLFKEPLLGKIKEIIRPTI